MNEGPLMLFFNMKKYQKRLYALLFFSAIFNAFLALIPLVASYVPEFECDIGTLIVSTNSTNQSQLGFDDQTKRFFIPVEKKDAVGKTELSSCFHYNRTWHDYLRFTNSANQSVNDFSMEKVPCKSHIFHFEEGESSAAIEFQMYCEGKWRKSLVVTLYMLGMLMGTVFSGYLSDSFGRKYVFLFFQYLQFVAFFATGFCRNFHTYCAVVFIYGTSGLVNYMSAIVLGTEMTPANCRNLISMSVQLAFGVSYMIFPLFAYYIRSWRWFYWVSGSLGLIYIPYLWLIDESPRWLLSVGRRSEAGTIMRKIAEMNGEPVQEQEEEEDESHAERKSWREQVCILFGNSTLLARLLIMGSAWCMLTISYYGIAMTTNRLHGNRFLNCFLSGATETVSYFISYLVVEYFGRRNPYVACTLVAAVSIAIAPFLGLLNPYLMTATTFIAKFFVSISFYIVYVMTPELFPTQLRHTTTALDSGFARVGGIIVSFILYKDKYITGPVIGAVIFVMTIPVLTIPKTHNVPLPETIQEAVELNNGVLRLGRGGRQKKRNVRNENCLTTTTTETIPLQTCNNDRKC